MAVATSSGRYSEETQDLVKTAAALGIMDCEINDPIEAMLIGHIVSAHSTGMELRRIAWIDGQPFETMTRYLALADKAARTVAALTEALNRHRGKGQQTVRVEHVHVAAGGQAIVGNVSHDGGEGWKTNRGSTS
jgi:hypothetical protein